MAPTCRILNQTDWDILFPREKYDQFKEDKTKLSNEDQTFIREHSLKFLIAQNSTDSTISSYIQTLSQKRSPQINSVATNHEVTPLIIAVMKGNEEIVVALVAAGADLEKKDVYGWTPLHHATLTSKKIFQFLVSKQANIQAQTNLNASMYSLASLSGIKEPNSRGQRLLYRSQEGNLREISPKEVETLTGLKHYREELLYPQELLKNLWTAPVITNLNDKNIEGILKRWLSNPPALILSCSQHSLASSRNYGLFAGENLAERTFITQYVGKVTPPPVTRSFYEVFEKNFIENCYQLDDLDAEELGNMSRFLNDGFPNITIVDIKCSSGRQRRGLFMSIDPIKKGEELTWNYGSGDSALKWGKYTILNIEQMHTFFKMVSVEELVNRINRSLPTSLELYGSLTRLQYIFDTPAALIDLTLSQIVSPKDWFKIKNCEQFLNLCPNGTHFHTIVGLLHLLVKFDDALRNNGSTISAQIRTFFQQKCTGLTVFQIVEGIDDVTKWLGRLNSPTANLEQLWNDKMEALQKKLPFYYWLEHRDFVLYDRTLQHQLWSQDLKKMN